MRFIHMSNKTAGTPEETKLAVKRLGNEWIVENNEGESIGTATDQSGALELARQMAPDCGASLIALHDEAGAVERVVEV